MGAAVNGALILIGDRLGLYKAMAGASPPITRLLPATKTSPRSPKRSASDAGVTNAAFEVAAAKSFPDHGGYDMVTFFDSLHDMGDPAGVHPSTF